MTRVTKEEIINSYDDNYLLYPAYKKPTIEEKNMLLKNILRLELTKDDFKEFNIYWREVGEKAWGWKDIRNWRSNIKNKDCHIGDKIVECRKNICTGDGWVWVRKINALDDEAIRCPCFLDKKTKTLEGKTKTLEGKSKSIWVGQGNCMNTFKQYLKGYKYKISDKFLEFKENIDNQ